MRLLFLGTGGAAGLPSPFCACRSCQRARRRGGRSVRLRSHALVDDDLLIDLGPDLLASTQRQRVDLTRVRDVVLTHAHEDHVEPLNLRLRSQGYSRTPPAELTVHGTAPSLARLAEETRTGPKEQRIRTRTFRPGDTFAAGRYRVAAVPAAHSDPEMEACILVVERGEATLLYGTDTGPLPTGSWELLRRFRFDAAIFEANEGPGRAKESHQSLASCADHLERLAREGLLKPGARRLATHVAHENDTPDHAALSRRARSLGLEIAYDGLVVDLPAQGT